MNATGKNVSMTEMEIIQSNDNNSQQPIVSSVDIVEAAESVIESDQKIDDESLTTDNFTVTYNSFLFSLFPFTLHKYVEMI